MMKIASRMKIVQGRPANATTIWLDHARITVDHFTDTQLEQDLARAIADFLIAAGIEAQVDADDAREAPDA